MSETQGTRRLYLPVVPALRAAVESVFVCSHPRGFQARYAASEKPVLALSLGPPLHQTGLKQARFDRGVVAGACSLPDSVLYPPGSHRVVAVLHPGYLPCLTGAGAGDFSELIVAWEDVWGPAARLIEEKILEAGSDAAAARAFQDALAGRLAPAKPPPLLVLGAVERLRRAEAPVGVGELVRELGVSRQRLHVLLKDWTGFGPRTLGRILRFRRACEALRARAESQALAAAHAEYYDQAHMLREFRRLAGTTPSKAASLAV